jgi:Flp pilus assembly pilin Flp
MAITKSRTRKRGRNRKGQAITEYGAIIAFVALLVALSFGFTKGSLAPALSAAFSCVKANLDNMSNAAATSSS